MWNKRFRTNYFDGGGFVNTDFLQRSSNQILQGIAPQFMNQNITQPFINTTNNTNPGIPDVGNPGLQKGLGIATGAISLTNQVMGNLSVPDVNVDKSPVNTKGDLFARGSNFNGYNLKRSNPLGSSLSGGLNGAMAGSSLGPLGAGIGAGVGILTGGISSIFGNRKRKKRERKLNQQFMNNLNAQNMNINEDILSKSLSQQFAFGGKLSPHAYGGMFSNGLSFFNTGGTHEENPLGGILQGFDEEGNPNLVEEGEVKWNDFIFSDRLIVPDITKDNLPKEIIGKTFAEATEYLQEESEERENDSISKLGLESNLFKLMMVQENMKENKETNKENIFAEGGPLYNMYDPASNVLSSIDDINKSIFDNKKRIGKTKLELGTVDKELGTVEEQFRKALAKEGFSPDDIDAFIHIAHGESSMQLDAYRDASKNPGGGNDSGLLQFNDKVWSELKNKYDLNTIEGQAKAAKEVYNKEGFAPWFGINNDNPWGKGLSLSEKQDINNLYSNRGKWYESMGIDPKSNPKSNPKGNYDIYDNQSNTKKEIPLSKDKLSTNDIKLDARDPKKINTNIDNNLTTQIQGITPETIAQNNSGNSDLLRYAPIAANLGLLASDIASSPDRINLGRISPELLAERMQYNPLDSEYLLNQMKQQGAGITRGLIDSSAGNRGIAQASLLAANRGTQDAMGDAMIKVNEMNDNKLSRVKDFNRQTDMFNISNDFKAQEYNTNTFNQETLWNKQADASRRNAIRAGVSNIGTSLGNIGTENRWMGIAEKVGLGYNSKGEYNKGKERGLFNYFKCGGKIYKKKIK